MKHAPAELIDIARLHYASARPHTSTDVLAAVRAGKSLEDAIAARVDEMARERAAEMETDERRRLTAARVEAGARRGPWRAMMARLREHLPGWDVHDDVYSCPPDALSASYEASIGFPAYTGPKLTGAEDEDAQAIIAGIPPYDLKLSFCVSFLVPYYVIYATRTIDDPEKEEAIRQRHEKTVLLGVGEDGEQRVLWALPREVVKPEVIEEIDRDFERRKPATRREVLFEFSPEAQPYAARIAREIEATYGYEPMPPEVGRVIVPDVEIGGRLSGEATLYDCLFSETL